MISRPLNIHPDIWKLRNTERKSVQQKKIQLDEYTKLNNAIDMIVQGLSIFKETYQNINIQQYNDVQKQGLIFINNTVDCALIPYTIDIVKKFNSMNIQELNNE